MAKKSYHSLGFLAATYRLPPAAIVRIVERLRMMPAVTLNETAYFDGDQQQEILAAAKKYADADDGRRPKRS